MVVSGYGIIDSTDFIFEDKVPRLNVEHMRQGYNFFKKNYQEYRALAWARKSTSYMEMLGKYFRTFDEAIKQYE